MGLHEDATLEYTAKRRGYPGISALEFSAVHSKISRLEPICGSSTSESCERRYGMSVESNARIEVERGTNLLDEKGPPMWFLMIDEDNLSVSEPNRCPGSQLYGSFDALITTLFGYDWPGQLSRHGFACFTHEDSIYVREWKKQIERRMQAKFDSAWDGLDPKQESPIPVER